MQDHPGHYNNRVWTKVELFIATSSYQKPKFNYFREEEKFNERDFYQISDIWLEMPTIGKRLKSESMGILRSYFGKVSHSFINYSQNR